MDNEPVLSRGRVLVGLLAAVAGTAWAVGGADELRRAGRLVLVILPALFVVLAAAMVLRAAMPAGTVAGPILLLVLAGGFVITAAVVFGWISTTNLTDIGAIAVTGGGVAVALWRRSTGGEFDIVIRRRTAVLLSTPDMKITGVAPEKVVLRAVLGGKVHLDLSAAELPLGADQLVVDISSFCGRVELTVRKDWPVHHGRVVLARRIRFEGILDADVAPRVVLNVQGLGGCVWLGRS